MDIRITITVGELRERGILEAFCELFHADINALTNDKQLCVLNQTQAHKIGLQIGEQVADAPKPKRGRKSKTQNE